jgi:hypothetical protein
MIYQRTPYRVLLAVLILGAGSVIGGAQPKLTPQEAGLRYGQASGAADTCPNTAMTLKGEALRQLFQGAANEAFKAEAAKTYEAWTTALTCTSIDPTTGRTSAMCGQLKADRCRQAYGEIGPTGTVMPGLLDQTVAR